MSEKDSYRIGELADEFNISLRSLRFYEDRGMIKPARVGSTRIYSREDHTRLRLILLFKTLGFSLFEAQQIIDIYSNPKVKRRQLEIMRDRLSDQQKFLREQSDELEKSLQLMNDTLSKVNKKIREKSKAGVQYSPPA
ncbi:MerR family transcriptional regulator [Aurantimonas sp. A2-1-M11]|uniref:MerR family transcriptional regulator n=1 Tax=Aurantimonas sp. A2-1-M11 TaxID=3113712 RepID=UPI002F9448B7